MRHGSRIVLFRLLMTALFLTFCFPAVLRAASPADSGRHIVLLRIHDTVQPMSDEYLQRGLKSAADTRAEAVVVELDTPGGLLDSTRDMVRGILDSPVPVLVFVGPSGSRAASAGFFLLEAADIAAMAPGTNTGAAHPVVEIGKVDPIMKQKVENDVTAFLRSYVGQRKRNAEAANAAVMESKSYTAEEARQLNLIDVVAPTTEELLRAVDGRTITRFNGQTVTLHTHGASILPIEPTLRENILDRLMDPNLALLILVVGALLIYLEFNTPGTIVPGAIGTLLVLLALFALNLLPVRYMAVLLIVAAFTLMLLEVKFASHGVLAGVAILCLIFGALTLVAGPIPELRVHPATAIAAGFAFGLITVFLVRLAIRARRSKSRTGVDALLGEVGVAMQPLEPSGQVLVHGELWQSESPDPIQKGEQVRVRGVRDLTLLVERVPSSQSAVVSSHHG
ncbi:MAG TPA: nodulation protein NfeD [Acidisarcina sp.]|nr:nodulation protein NfeD [Acidisarcina sp.]